jgi:hypothetical protein
MAVKFWTDAMPTELFNQREYDEDREPDVSTERSVYHYVINGVVQTAPYDDPTGRYIPVATAVTPVEVQAGISAAVTTSAHVGKTIVHIGGAPVYAFTGVGFYENVIYFEVQNAYGIDPVNWWLVFPDGTSSPTGCASSPSTPPSTPPAL